MQNQTSSSLATIQLKKLRAKAIRAGVWFKGLPRIDRVLIELTIKVTENVRSSLLARSVFAVVGKLEELTQSKPLQTLRCVGEPLARQISLIAQKLGNNSAKSWANDISFALFLAVMRTSG